MLKPFPVLIFFIMLNLKVPLLRMLQPHPVVISASLELNNMTEKVTALVIKGTQWRR
jgi:hypothetical protein